MCVHEVHSRSTSVDAAQFSFRYID